MDRLPVGLFLLYLEINYLFNLLVFADKKLLLLFNSLYDN